MFDLSDKPTKETVQKWRFVQLLRRSAFLMWFRDLWASVANRDSFESRLLQGILDEDIKDKIQFVRDSLDELVQLSKVNEFAVTLVVIPVAAQARSVYPDELYQSTLKQYADENSLDMIDLLPALRAYYEQHGSIPVIPFDGHYNSEGHELFADALVKQLLRSESLCTNGAKGPGAGAR